MIATKGWLAAWAAIGAVSFAACNAPASHADTPGLTCEHRGMGHIDKHGGKTEDDAFHRLHHQRLTCDGDDAKHDNPGDTEPFERHDDELLHGDEHSDKGNKHDDDVPLPGHRDKPGYGCFMLRCG